MKKFLFLCAALVSISSAFSQKSSITWGDDFKLHKSSQGLSVIYTDKTGVYLNEEYSKKRVFTRKTYFYYASLVKLDPSFTQVYKSDFKKELKKKDFKEFVFIKGKLFILATAYNSKEKQLILYGAPVDKSSGKLSGEWIQLTYWQKESKKDNIEFDIAYNADSSNIMIVSSVLAKDKNTYEFKSVDQNLRVGKSVALGTSFDPKTFKLQDLRYLSNGNLVVVGRMYEYEEGKRKKDKFLDFKNYNIKMYDGNGGLIKEINTDIDSKWLMSTKVLQEKDKDLVLAAFYSNQPKGKTIDGLLVERIDPKTGEVISTSHKDINTSLLTVQDTNDDGDDDDRKSKKEEKKLQDTKDAAKGFSNNMVFRKILYTPDGGLVILAEDYSTYIYTVSSTTATGTGGYTTSSFTYEDYSSGSIFMTKVDSKGEISWLNILPKYQKESIQIGSGIGPGIGVYYSSIYYTGSKNTDRPYYSGFGTMQSGNNIFIIFNDNKANANVLQPGQKVKRAWKFKKSSCYAVTLDVTSGKYKRSELFDNSEGLPAMPRLGSVVGNDMYLLGRKDNMSKSKIVVGKLTIR